MLDDGLEHGDSALAHWVVLHSGCPELANAGMWYFGARIAPQRLIHERALVDPGYAWQLADRHVARLNGAVAAWARGLGTGT
jgi:hypothetical protein